MPARRANWPATRPRISPAVSFRERVQLRRGQCADAGGAKSAHLGRFQRLNLADRQCGELRPCEAGQLRWRNATELGIGQPGDPCRGPPGYLPRGEVTQLRRGEGIELLGRERGDLVEAQPSDPGRGEGGDVRRVKRLRVVQNGELGRTEAHRLRGENRALTTRRCARRCGGRWDLRPKIGLVSRRSLQRRIPGDRRDHGHRSLWRHEPAATRGCASPVPGGGPALRRGTTRSTRASGKLYR